ncbi:MAG: hypothetical protein SPH14_10385 [Ligilactobacillus salivarius]|nr:hypothetical protein [Ligilactobacillus salivarius]
MYLYFDNNGILKEIVDDVATRKGNNEVNRLYIYVDGITPKTEWITYQTSDGVQSNETLIETTITKTIPYDRNRDLKYFKNFQEYLFYVATIPSSVLTVSGLTKASVRVALQDDSLMTLGLIIFTIEESVVLQDSFITESQYQYLLNIISNFEELDKTGVIGITTQIVNGAVAPYDQGRIVLSTYNDNFTIATVVKNSTGQNVYNVLDMTFVKQVPYDNSKPNLEGLEINGKKYKVAYKTSQLNNDAGFITNAVGNLINYYDKNTVDKKLANIDLSEYYTKTESDGRYVLTTNFSWNNLANKPTSLSDFVNDEGFITNTVSNLSNYYDKTTIDNIVATLKTGAFQVVNELPSTGVEGVVYLVGTEAPYTMYIWENNAFLDIGTTEVNLDGYVKGTNLNSNYVILGNGGSNVVASSYTINNQNANDPNSLLTAKVINTLLGTKQDVLTQGQGVKISDNVVSTPVSTTSTTISQQSVNKLKYDGKPILVDYAVNDDSGNIIADTYATFNDLHTLDIGDITSSSNIYQTLYQNVYENDTTKKNVVIFSTEGFVDSATSLISAGEHIATPYQDNKILIDSVFVLNSDNSATSIVSSDTVVIDIGTISEEGGTLSPTILSEINSAISDNKKIIFNINLDGDSGVVSNYLYEGNNTIVLFMPVAAYNGLLITIIITITLTDGNYSRIPFISLSPVNVKTVNGQSLIGSGNIEISGGESNNITIDLGELSTSGTLSSEILSQINNNLTSKSITFEGTLIGGDIPASFTSSTYTVFSSVSITSISITFLLGNSFNLIGITLPNGHYEHSTRRILVSEDTKTINNTSLEGAGNIAVQEPLVSGTNIKTVNNQSILGEGNIEISGSKFKIIDLTSDGNINSISSLYNAIFNSIIPDFLNQSAIFNNIATAVNNGLVPILKFTDGYGYYKEYLSSSSEYVFTLNHITTPELATNPANNVITLKVGNTRNNGVYNNLSQIPSTVVISSGAFGKSGTLSIEETNNFNKVLNDIDRNLSAGIFILNNVDKKIYYVSTLMTSSFEIIAYTVNKYGVEVLVFAKSGQQEDRLVYTKTTYALSGSSGNMVKLGTLYNSGTLEAEILQELLNLFDNFQIIQALFIYNNNIYITANAYSNGSSIGIVAYDVSNSLNAVNLSINTTNVSYTITPIEIPTHFKTINNQSLIGDGNIEISGGGEKVLNISITDILTDTTKIQTIFTAMQSYPTSKTHTGVLLDESIPLSAFQDCDKIILDLSGLSSLGLNVGGELIFTKGFNTNNFGRAFYLVYMTGIPDKFSIATVVLASGGDGNVLNRLVVEHSGTN